MVWEYCESSPLLLYSAVLDLYHAVSTPQLHKRPRVPLMKVKSWVRGGQPEYDGIPDNPVIRLSIDSRGLRRIETLKKWPSGIKSGSCLEEFVVEAAERFSGVLFESQVGQSREVRQRPLLIDRFSLALPVCSFPRAELDSTFGIHLAHPLLNAALAIYPVYLGLVILALYKSALVLD